MTAELDAAFADRDTVRVHAAASWLRAVGTPLVDIYEVVLAAATRELPRYPSTPAERLRAHDVQARVSDLVSRLRTPVRPTRGQVMIVVPGGSRNVLGIGPLEHVLADAGFAVVTAPGLELDDVEPLVAELDDPVALALGLHDPDLVPAARELVHRLRAACPSLRVVVGGQAVARVPALAASVGAHRTVSDARSALSAIGEVANPLSPRELAVLQCIAQGMSNPDAGSHLGVAAATVKTHLDRVFAKLGTSDRTATVALAMRRGWIE